MAAAASEPGGVTGYTVVLPPGWSRIPVRYGSAKAIRAVIGQALRNVPKGVPPDSIAPYRAELETRLRAMVTRARGQNGLDLYLPAAPMHGVPVPASFIVSEGAYGEPVQDADPAELVTLLAAGDAGSSTLTVDGVPALRREHAEPAEPDAEADAGTRRVDYVIPVPGGEGRWLIAAFSAIASGGPDDELCGILVQLFDAIMSTFRWSA